MKGSVEISLIIPVYNVEAYLDKCLYAILTQNYDNWEAILVDDGSTDSSSRICDEYREKDSRFKVFHKTNGGVSSARNVGLSKAKGRWLWFIDADDWISSDALEVLSKQLDNSNIDTIFFGIEYYDDKGNLMGVEDRPTILDKPKDEVIAISDYPPQNYLLKRDIVAKYNLQFSEGIATGEDLEFQYKYLMLCKQPVSINHRLYKYIRRDGSAMHNPRTLENMAKDSPRTLVNIAHFIERHRIRETKWLAHRINRAFKAAMSSSFHHRAFSEKTQIKIKEADRILKLNGFKDYSDWAVKIGTINLKIYFLFQYIRRIIRK